MTLRLPERAASDDGAAQPNEVRLPVCHLEKQPREWDSMSRTAVVVDDHPGFRGCARRVLEEHGFTVVGEAADAASALESARRLRPQLALVDVCLPDMDGFELASRLASLEEPPVVVLTSSHDPAELRPMVPSCSARGFIPKEQLSREAIEALL